MGMPQLIYGGEASRSPPPKFTPISSAETDGVSEPLLGGVGQRSPVTGMSPPLCTRRYCSCSDESDRHGDEDRRVFLRMRYLIDNDPSTLRAITTTIQHVNHVHLKPRPY